MRTDTPADRVSVHRRCFAVVARGGSDPLGAAQQDGFGEGADAVGHVARGDGLVGWWLMPSGLRRNSMPTSVTLPATCRRARRG
jgi:hypothetical protein